MDVHHSQPPRWPQLDADAAVGRLLPQIVTHGWCTAAAESVAPLYASEVRRWRHRLRWDSTSLWRDLEAARTAGLLSGLIATDASGDVCGWTFSTRHRGVLQIGGMVASSPAATRALLDGSLRSADAAGVRQAMAFGYFDAPGLSGALEARGFAAERYHYLEVRAAEAADAESDPRLRPLRPEDARAVAELFGRAYRGNDPVRPFAPGGTADEWLEYVTQLVHTNGCGDFSPAMSRVAPAAGDAIDGAVLVTKIARGTAHIAQMAVRPAARGKGLGRRLVTAALAAAHREGCQYTTLLVAEKNVTAQALYARLGFQTVERFVAAASSRIPEGA